MAGGRSCTYRNRQALLEGIDLVPAFACHLIDALQDANRITIL